MHVDSLITNILQIRTCKIKTPKNTCVLGCIIVEPLNNGHLTSFNKSYGVALILEIFYFALNLE